MTKIKEEFFGCIGLRYVLSVTLEDYSLYTIPSTPDSLLVSVDALRARLSFPLDAFTVEYV